MNKIWSSIDVEKATNGKINRKWFAGRISIDSRNINKGDLFIALRGKNTDGHNYLKQALENGASAVVIEYIPNNLENFNYCLVEDTKEALNDLAIFNRSRLDAEIIAVTGSVGKTSTKEMLKVAFEPFGKVFANYGNYNNDLGVAISLASTELDTKYAIYEVGMNHPGEIIPLVKMIKPNIAVITNVEAVHLEFFDSVKDIARAKAEIFTGLDKDGYAILNSDNKWYDFLVEEANKENIENIISFGKSDNANIKLLSYNNQQEDKLTLKLSIGSEQISYNLNFDSEHLANTSLIALAAVKAFNLDIKIAINNLLNFSPAKGRGRVSKVDFHNKKITLINDSYNASPASVIAALRTLSGKKDGRKIAILADMRELGEKSVDFHKDLLNYINEIDKVITVGHYMSYLFKILPNDKKLFHYENTELIIDNIDQCIADNDFILVKGSLGTGIYKLADFIISNSNATS